jgi:hypothetical protein
MRLDSISVAVRERHPWEAMDLGFAMVRSWAGGIYCAWIAFVWPIALLLHLVFGESLWAATLVFWWFKPLFDRVPLAALSRAFFGETPGARQALRGYSEVWSRGFVASLTWRRLSPWRSYVMPVDQLEKLRGTARRQRMEVLTLEGLDAAIWLTAVSGLLELAVWLALIGLVALVVPGELEPAPWLGAGAPAWIGYALSAGYVVVVTAVEPFYVAAGFALYVNRRVALEAWDIELGLKRLAERLRRAAAARASAAGPAGIARALVLALAVAVPAVAEVAHGAEMQQAGIQQRLSRHTVAEALGPSRRQHARAVRDVETQPPASRRCGTSSANERRPPGLREGPRAPSVTEIRRAAVEVLADRDFAHCETRLIWMPSRRSPTQTKTWDWALLKHLGQLLATAFKWLALAFVGVATAVAGSWLWRRYWAPARRRPATPSVAQTVLGLDIRPEMLPADIVTAAVAEWQQGRRDRALSLLYRGALAFVVNRCGIAVTPSATEDECIRAVETSCPTPIVREFRRLTDAWREAAYARRPPEGRRFLDLCAAWTRYLRASP